MTTTVVEEVIEEDVTTRPQVVRVAGPWDSFCKYALPATMAGALVLMPNASTTNRTPNRDYIVIPADSATFRQPILSLRARGWAFAQRMADASKLAAATYQDDDEDDENLVEPPDPSIWEHLPATSW